MTRINNFGASNNSKTKKKRNVEIDETSSSSRSDADKRKKIHEPDNEIINESLEKIIRQNTNIISKIDTLDIRISKIEELITNNKNNEVDKVFLKKIIEEIAKEIFAISIYPTPDEFRNISFTFLKENYAEFMKQFHKNDKWIAFYERNLSKSLLDKQRSVRGSFASKVKDTIYVVFKDFKLTAHPPITPELTESKIREWKKNPAVKKSFENLFKKINNSDPETYLSRIIQSLSKKKMSNHQIAYAISICEVMLNPQNLHVQISEPVIKPIFTKYFKKITNKENLLSDDDDGSLPQEAEEEPQKDDEAEIEPEKNEEIGENEEEEYNYQGSSTDEETKEKMRELRKQYKKK